MALARSSSYHYCYWHGCQWRHPDSPCQALTNQSQSAAGSTLLVQSPAPAPAADESQPISSWFHTTSSAASTSISRWRIRGNQQLVPRRTATLLVQSPAPAPAAADNRPLKRAINRYSLSSATSRSARHLATQSTLHLLPAPLMTVAQLLETINQLQSIKRLMVVIPLTGSGVWRAAQLNGNSAICYTG